MPSLPQNSAGVLKRVYYSSAQMRVLKYTGTKFSWTIRSCVPKMDHFSKSMFPVSSIFLKIDFSIVFIDPELNLDPIKSLFFGLLFKKIRIMKINFSIFGYSRLFKIIKYSHSSILNKKDIIFFSHFKLTS